MISQAETSSSGKAGSKIETAKKKEEEKNLKRAVAAMLEAGVKLPPHRNSPLPRLESRDPSRTVFLLEAIYTAFKIVSRFFITTS